VKAVAYGARLSILGENAAAGQECPAYRIFGIAVFVPAYRIGYSEAFS